MISVFAILFTLQYFSHYFIGSTSVGGRGVRHASQGLSPKTAIGERQDQLPAVLIQQDAIDAPG